MTVVLHQFFSKRDRQSRVAGGKAPKLVAVERALAHVKYIQHRPGEDRGDGGREMFNDTEENLDSQVIRKAIRKQENSKVIAHKLTLAPEIDPADKKAFTREVMQKLSSDKGLDLDWVGVEHKNTNHHHIHLVVLGKDKNGTDVRIEKEDYAKLREWGDRYLERVHPLELERSRSEREKKQRVKQQAKQKARETNKQERIKDGLELPWMHKKIVREQLEPYKEWKEKKEQKKEKKAKERAEKVPAVENEKPYFQDTITAADETWSRENSLKELEELNQNLWDDKGDWIPKEDYGKLLEWMKEKRELSRPGKSKGESTEGDKPARELKDYIEYKGQRYSENSPHEKLSELTAKLREKNSERLPFDEYNQLRGWLEDKDRAKWSGILDRQLTAQHKKDFTKTNEQLKSLEGGRVINPLQENIMSNPVVGLFMQGASLANTVVSWIPVLENRDRLKEGKDALESKKLDKHQDYVKADRTPEQKDRDKASIDKLDEAIEDNQAARDTAKDEKKKKQDRNKEDDPHLFDPWGRF